MEMTKENLFSLPACCVMMVGLIAGLGLQIVRFPGLTLRLKRWICYALGQCAVKVGPLLKPLLGRNCGHFSEPKSCNTNGDTTE